MKYEEQVLELEKLVKQCDKMQEKINTKSIWALNDINTFNEHSGNLAITDEKWCNFCDDFKTYFAINPDPELQTKFENLVRSNLTVSSELISEMRKLINQIKNKAKIKKYNP